jgi:hypothetical protein
MFASLSLKPSRCAVCALAAVLAAFPLGAAADSLDKEACDKLQAEKQTLVVLGVDKEFAKGADWAKANLKPAELNLIKRYIIIDETLKFRCGMAVAALSLPDDIDETLADLPGAVLPPPMPVRRDQALAAPSPVTAGTAAMPKPTTAPAVKPQPAAVKPAPPQAPAGAQAPAAARPAAAQPPAAAPVKPAPKPAAAKPQSSWNANTLPVQPQAAESPAHGAPAANLRVRRVEAGD